jgi:teichuronic acid exporter
MTNILSKAQYKSIGWSFSERLGSQSLAFIFSILLTRLLSPTDFGLIGMILVFIALGQSLIDSGMTSSLIKKDSPDDLDYSVVFITNLVFSLLIYLCVFLVAPLISAFYDQPELISILRVYSLGFVFIALSAIQQTLLVKALAFRKLALIKIPATLFSGLIGASMAWKGFGVWSLVGMYLSNQIILSILFWLLGNWKFSFRFDTGRFKEHFGFGYKLSLAGILNTLFENLYNVLIGRFFVLSTLGFYTRANMLKQYPVETFASALQKVTYPIFANQRKDIDLLKGSFKELTQRVIFVIAPMMLLGAALAKPLFLLLFGEEWLESVPYFQILCLTGILYPIHSYNLNVLNVFGRSDLFLKLEVIKKIQILGVVVIAFQFGIYGLIWAQVITSATSFFINTYYTGKFLDYGFWHQLRDIFPSIGIAFVAGIFVIFLQEIEIISQMMNILNLLISIAAGAIIYLTMSFFFRITPSVDLLHWFKFQLNK